METTVINGMCRCCASEGAFKDIKRSYQWMGDEEVYGEMLKECFDIDLSATEDSDGSICEVCITQLRNACNFKKQVLQTEDHFKKQLQIKFFKPTVVKVEMQDENNQSDDNISLDDGFSGPEFDMPIKKEGTEESKPKKRAAAAKASTSRAKKSKANDESADTSTTKRTTRRTRIIRIAKRTTPTIELKLTKWKTREELRMGPKNGVSEAHKNRMNLKNVLLYSNATPIKLKDSLGYRCSFCPKQFSEPMGLKRHTLNEHNDHDLIKQVSQKFYEQVIKLDTTLLNCALCDTDFDQLNDFIKHLNSEHGKITYTDVKNWILPFKFDAQELRCSICGTIFATFKLLYEHMNKHYPNYVCEICGVGYITDTLRKRHLKRHGDGEYKCDQCDKVFTSTHNRNLHVRRIHLGQSKRNVCKFCDERFSDYWKKIDHMVKEHGLPPVVLNCQACDRTFTNQRKLNKHTKKDHLFERKHKCTECEMRFFGKSTLQKHMTKHTGLRQYQCDVCFKWYGRKQTLREHLRIHANDRRFSCVHCGQAFVQKCSWKSHMKSKHGEVVS